MNATDERRETSATIHLNSSYEGTGVCIGDRVVFRCTVIGPPLLQWVVESINTFNTKPIQFNVVTDMPGTIPDPFPEVTNVTLISVEQDTENPFQGALVSEITVLVTSTTLGKHVYCSHGQLGEQETPSILIQSASKCSFYGQLLIYITLLYTCNFNPPFECPTHFVCVYLGYFLLFLYNYCI